MKRAQCYQRLRGRSTPVQLSFNGRANKARSRVGVGVRYGGGELLSSRAVDHINVSTAWTVSAAMYRTLTPYTDGVA